VLDDGESVVLAGGARTVSDGRGVVDEVRRAVAVREVAAALGGAPWNGFEGQPEVMQRRRTPARYSNGPAARFGAG
jgi:hypothetical protein